MNSPSPVTSTNLQTTNENSFQAINQYLCSSSVSNNISSPISLSYARHFRGHGSPHRPIPV